MERHLMEMDSIGGFRCPAPEDLAAFTDGQISGAQRSQIELHLADCDACRELVAETVLLSKERLPGFIFGQPRRRAIAGGGAALALAASLVAVIWPFDDQPDYGPLVAAVGQNRTVEGRLTGGFSYAPMKRATRAGRTGADEDFALLAAKGKLEADAQAKPTAANRHAAAVAQLVAGDSETAIATLESVVAETPQAAAYSDLAAAYLARGREWDRQEDFDKARAAAERAIVMDPSLDEPYFNRALALDALGRAREAEAAYRRALGRDPRSPWNAEITMRLEQMRRP
jgi:tetratricopeptide (TPR) repeat protein